jgi:hypothetical protein
LVNYFPPVDIEVDVTPGIVSGTNIAVFDGTNGSEDWRGRKAIVSQPGTGPLVKNRDYVWNSSTGALTITSAFEPNQFFHIEFELTDIQISLSTSFGEPLIQYPHLIVINSSNWNSSSQATVEKKGRCELGSNARKGFNEEDPTIIPKAIIYVPLPVPDVQIGDIIKAINEQGKELIGGPVRQFSKGQLNARIWL